MIVSQSTQQYMHVLSSTTSCQRQFIISVCICYEQLMLALSPTSDYAPACLFYRRPRRFGCSSAAISMYICIHPMCVRVCGNKKVHEFFNCALLENYNRNCAQPTSRINSRNTVCLIIQRAPRAARTATWTWRIYTSVRQWCGTAPDTDLCFNSRSIHLTANQWLVGTGLWLCSSMMCSAQTHARIHFLCDPVRVDELVLVSCELLLRSRHTTVLHPTQIPPAHECV